jgi:NAD(P)-dependent dehydrogenase (short-subunit alcohol dehydrogenase family)
VDERLGSPSTGVLITGGGSGIGRQTALALAEVARPVAIWDIDADGAEETATLCRDRHGVVAHWSAVDVSSTEAVGAVLPETAAALGSLGGFVHAAGVSGVMAVDST